MLPCKESSFSTLPFTIAFLPAEQEHTCLDAACSSSVLLSLQKWVFSHLAIWPWLWLQLSDLSYFVLHKPRERFTDTPTATNTSFLLTLLYTKVPSFTGNALVVVGFTVVPVCFALNCCLYECNCSVWEYSVTRRKSLVFLLRLHPSASSGSEKSLVPTEDPERSLTEYIHRLEVIQQRLGGMHAGENNLSPCFFQCSSYIAYNTWSTRRALF